jgi:hypothetical protein
MQSPIVKQWDLQGVMQVKKRNTIYNRWTAQCHQLEQIDPVDYIPVMGAEEG